MSEQEPTRDEVMCPELIIAAKCSICGKRANQHTEKELDQCARKMGRNYVAKQIAGSASEANYIALGTNETKGK